MKFKKEKIDKSNVYDDLDGVIYFYSKEEKEAQDIKNLNRFHEAKRLKEQTKKDNNI